MARRRVRLATAASGADDADPAFDAITERMMPVSPATRTMIGRRVRIDGLTINVDLNKCVGTVTEDLVQGERFTVQVKQVLKGKAGVQQKLRNVRVRRDRCALALQPIGCSASSVAPTCLWRS